MRISGEGVSGAGWRWIPAAQADPTAGGNRPAGCICAWTEQGAGHWKKGDDHAQCPVHKASIVTTEQE